MSDRLYVVDVEGGGTFLYDTIDVGRFALRMAEAHDERPFTVRPQSRRMGWFEVWRGRVGFRLRGRG